MGIVPFGTGSDYCENQATHAPDIKSTPSDSLKPFDNATQKKTDLKYSTPTIQYSFIRDLLDSTRLEKIVKDNLKVLETIVSVNDPNGDTVLAASASDWCRCLDQASAQKAIETNRSSVSGYNCHQVIMDRIILKWMETRMPVDIACDGGLRVYAVPIQSSGELIGFITMGYGNPPNEDADLEKVADHFNISRDTLARYAESYKGRPAETIAIAKRQIVLSAELIGEIVKREDLEKALNRSQDRMDFLFDSLPHCYLSLDAQGRVEEINPRGLDLLGYLHQDMTGHHIVDFMDQESQIRFQQILPMTLSTGSIKNQRFFFLKRDQLPIQVSFHGSVRFDQEGQPKIHIVFRDVTRERQVQKEKKDLEKRLRQAQKMESIGNLAGGIAHDFNNLLFPIIVMAELLMEDLPPKSHERENAKEIYEAATRARGLVKQILTINRQTDLVKVPMKIQTVLKEVARLSRAIIPSSIEVLDNIQEDCGPVLAEPTRIHQVAMNLMTNAFHAVEEGKGQIILKLEDLLLADESHVHPSVSPGRYAVISVTDNGSGMAQEALKYIFEPYFTTKSKEKGTGLGLTVVKGIVLDHDGEIRVKSRPGNGTVVSVYLPVTRAKVALERPETKPVPQMGSGRVLLVDDEKQVVLIEKKILERAGFQVFEEFKSQDALETFRRTPNAFDLVITDMTMPEMTGAQLIEKIKQIRPNIPVIICTGYSETMDAERALAIGAKGFLMKPLNKERLIAMIRELLDNQ